ncbi:hypothetical protein KAJ83_11000 [Marivibrio halodurans]|uniref:Uncharacterized protein n=1 Tax=Marivibrio halodurans TaxID=2039722 RepID=A0A8J7SMQ0_9PROT|nr:hypothetical protein [Marivibrio halodurans]MBP5857538.1 hypothetical protein [Marivibrio halodurans]
MGSKGASGLLAEVAAAHDVEALHHALLASGIPFLFWQRYEPDTVATWDRFPAGFFAHYYGTDADQECAVAQAVRANWQLFAFDQARAALGAGGGAKAAERVWRAFGVADGLVVPGGLATTRTITVLGFPRDGRARAMIAGQAAALRCLASQLDRFLMDSDILVRIPRQLIPLSDAMRDVLRIQIEHPGLTAEEQANALGISPRMLEKRHKQIAKRFGVSSFAGAVAVAVRTPAAYWR